MKKTRVITGELSFVELYKPIITLFIAALFAVTLAAMTFASNNAEIYSFEKVTSENILATDSAAEEMLKLHHNAIVPLNVYKVDDKGNKTFLCSSDPSIEGHTIILPLLDDEMAWFSFSEDYSSILTSISESLPEGDEPASPDSTAFIEQAYDAGYEYISYDDGNFALLQTQVSEASETPTASGNNHAMATPDPGMLKVMWHEQNVSSPRVVTWGLTSTGSIKGIQTTADSMPNRWLMGGIGDINNDGMPDILWHEQNVENPRVVAWFLSQDSVIASMATVAPSMPNRWLMGGIGDINKDGTVDILWHEQNVENPRVVAWFLNADGSIASMATVAPSMPNRWLMGGIGDINKDGTVDILWHEQNVENPRVVAWFLNTDGSIASMATVAPSMPNRWLMGGIGDINKDGTVDILWHEQNVENPRVVAWFLNADGSIASMATVAPSMPNRWLMGGIGDINNDGSVDILWHEQNVTNPRVVAWLLNADASIGSMITTAANMPNRWLMGGVGE